LEIKEALEFLASAPGLTQRAMFGGFSFYSEGRIFAILHEGDIYLKGDTHSISGYEEAGAEMFTYIGMNGPSSMKYFKFSDAERTKEFIPTALEVAHRAPMPKPKKPKI
jgi:DNA transformation protein and related proteins